MEQKVQELKHEIERIQNELNLHRKMLFIILAAILSYPIILLGVGLK